VTDDEIRRIARVSAGLIVEAMLDLLQTDGHQWSSRPCDTCRAISGLAGRTFGCIRYAEEHRKAQAAGKGGGNG
jgi:hypothetical protein